MYDIAIMMEESSGKCDVGGFICALFTHSSFRGWALDWCGTV